MAFTVSGSSAAESLVSQVFDAQFAIAQSRLDQADALASDAVTASAGMSWLNRIELGEELNIPAAPELDGFSSSEMNNLYQSTADEIKTMLANGLTSFLTTFFPLGNELASAQAWIAKALSTGGTGLNAAVEDQIWQRDRTRLLADASRAASEAMSTWAARGYALPPGALVGQVARIEQDARDKIAAASRDVAIQQAQMELDNIKFAVEKAIALRVAAIQAAGEYIKTLALGPQLGTQLATSMVDAKAKIAQAMTNFYQAEISALELPVKLAIAEGSINAEVGKANLASFTSTNELRARVATAAMQQVGTQAAAALNALHANAGFSGSEQV